MSQRSPTLPDRFDVLLVGGGLANSLIALELRRRRPELRVGLVDPDRQPKPHTWCLFGSDTTADRWALLEPTLDHVWAGYDVSFPRHARTVATGYGCLTSSSLRAQVESALADSLLHGYAREVGPNTVVCESGETLDATLVIDGRGASPSPHMDIRFQKFVGLELRSKRPHGLQRPVVMDATVRQIDGFRFMYVLPLGPDRLLVEDTRYSDGGDLDRMQMESEVLRYARGAGWGVAEVVRREHGALPVVLNGDIDAFWESGAAEIPRVGMRGAFFHPVTGYSFPDALEVADLVVGGVDLGGGGLASRLRDQSKRLWRQRGFYRMLNRMLFGAAAPEMRHRVLERFYRLPIPLIERFYAGRTSFPDKLRILAGRPPVPVRKALMSLPPVRSRPVHG